MFAIRIIQIVVGLGFLGAMLWAPNEGTRALALLVIAGASLLSFGGFWPTWRRAREAGWRARCWGAASLLTFLAFWTAISWQGYEQFARGFLHNDTAMTFLSLGWLLVLVELPFAPEVDPDAEQTPPRAAPTEKQ